VSSAVLWPTHRVAISLFGRRIGEDGLLLLQLLPPLPLLLLLLFLLGSTAMVIATVIIAKGASVCEHV
jgi:hypothetical protein